MGKQFYFVLNNGKKITLTPNSYQIISTQINNSTREYIIGRNSQFADIVIDHQSVSRKHAKLIVGANSLSIEDLNSVNGTYIEKKKLNLGQISLLRKELAIQFADSPDEYTIEEEYLSDDQIQRQEKNRSRSRSNEKMEGQDRIKQEKAIKKENQIWNMGDLNEQQKERMKKLMGVKNREVEESDQKDVKMDIKKRNNELERQFEMAMYKKNHKSNGLGY